MIAYKHIESQTRQMDSLAAIKSIISNKKVKINVSGYQHQETSLPCRTKVRAKST